MKKAPLLIVIGVAVGAAVFALRSKGEEKQEEIEFRYEKVVKGELIRSISATGVLVSLTTVDVKSKAGGNVVRLAVDEGAVVRKGDLIAIIDPADTQATFDQASADLQSANARAEQARTNLELQIETGRVEVQEAEKAVELAKVRLNRARVEATRQPDVTKGNVATAKANLSAAKTALSRLQDVTIPQARRDAAGDLAQAKAVRDAAAANLERQQMLFEKGYVSAFNVDQARSNAATARNAYENAVLRQKNVEADLNAQLQESRANLERAEAALAQATANQAQDTLASISVIEAQKTLDQANVALSRARANLKQNEVRKSEMVAAQASTVRSRVALQNAKVQLDSTTVLAPRDGVVTQKYIEEGTIIPPGLSTFAQGTSIVQLSDVTKLYVDCAVDEADIANVKRGQPVRIITEAFPGQMVFGVVERVNPSAKTENNVTAVKVRVEVTPGYKVRLLPGMNASCEFVTLAKKQVLIAPTQAVTTKDGKSFVRIKSADPKKPTEKEVKIGETGNEGVEILEGLNEGDEVVTAEINIAQLRETQKKMQEVQQGGGLAGGAPGGGGRRPGGGGGGRPR